MEDTYTDFRTCPTEPFDVRRTRYVPRCVRAIAAHGSTNAFVWVHALFSERHRNFQAGWDLFILVE
jgi:hypothetical protein